MAITLEVICAMLGNFYCESSVNSGAWNGYVTLDYSYVTDTSLTRAFGVAQWYDERRRNLGKYIYTTYSSDEYYNLDYQLDFLINESFWSQNRGDISSFSEFLYDSSHTLSDLTYAFLANWEIPTTDTDELANAFTERYSAALDFYTYLLDHYDDDVTTYVYQYSRITDENDYYNNAIYIYQYFNGKTLVVGTGGTGSDSDYNSSTDGSSGNSSILRNNTKLYLYSTQLIRLKRQGVHRKINKQNGIYLYGKRY